MSTSYTDEQRAAQEQFETTKMADLLPPRDAGRTEKGGGTITIEEYETRRAAPFERGFPWILPSG